MKDIEDRVVEGERLSVADAVDLYNHPNLPDLSSLADYVRTEKHPEKIVTYNLGRNINYTNVCWVKCSFCNFYAPPGSPDSYTLSKEEIFRKIEELIAAGGEVPEGCELLMQGGLNPKLRIDYFEDLFAAITERYPQAYLHALSATEILYIAHLSRLTVEETLLRLRAAGLKSIPGAGAEILSDAVRDQIAFRKDTTREWLNVHQAAHRLGMNTTATMMYGSVETPEQRLEHLRLIRETQDEALTNQATGQGGGKFTAFIAWSFQPDGTELQGKVHQQKATGAEYLRMVALSRVFLDNIDNLQASYVTQGAKIAQVALKYGLNDFGSSMMEENVVSAAGTYHLMSVSEIRRLITEAGYQPRRRNTRYELID
ncbi:MAG: dehypoxanthine futalosine cyclase [Armatimonadetes bacterium]|nr:dehypoxanthine futalosine cyclase [Armatimonadota bacterium]